MHYIRQTWDLIYLLVGNFFLQVVSGYIRLGLAQMVLMIITRDVANIQDLKQFLGQQFEMKYQGLLSYFLGLEVSSFSNSYYLTRAKYTSDLISLVRWQTHSYSITVISLLLMTNFFQMQLATNRQLEVSFISLSLTNTSPMLFTLSFSLWLPYDPLSVLLSSKSFGI